MKKCPMCGKELESKDVEEYVGRLFGYDADYKIWNDTAKICDTCCLSLYYADHPNVNE